MPFEEGKAKTGGRTKGTKDTYSKPVRDALAKLSADYILEDGVKGLKSDLDAMRPIDRAQTMERYLKYWLPTMGTLSIAGQNGDEPIEITVTYSKAAAADIDDDDEEIDYSEKV